jgi:hypothetical protein
MDMQVPLGVRNARRTNPVLEARSRSICARYAAGETLASLGSSFGISAERVRKILKKFGLDKRNGGLAVRNSSKVRMPPVTPYCMRVYGCTAGELDKCTPAERQAFLQQRTNVPWSLTLPEWQDIWFRSGKWKQRGRGPFKYGLCRIDAHGAFSRDNVLVLKNSRSARSRLKEANRLPPLEFQRGAWVLARLKAAWAGHPGANPVADSTIGAVVPEESAYRKYCQGVVTPERARWNGTDNARSDE